MNFSVYNTFTGEKTSFTPLEPNKIKMYVCGVTVYDYCHIGHARVMVCFDVISRYLRARGWDLTYVRNITDIDDKIIKRAAENNETIEQLTERFIAAMIEDETTLGVLRPDFEPRATQHIGDIIALITTLISSDYAYVASNGDVYYRVAKFADYGKLTNKNLDDLLAGARVAVDEAKQDPRDFVLWKAAKTGETYWPSPWGDGRPGWHIECSAMSKACLGTTLDIHGGGPDLPFPHHENEIAQSEAANHCTYANYWLHAGAVRLGDEKMSKSLGNFFTIRDVVKNHHPEIVRFLLMSSHYRSAINYTEESLKDARAGLERFYKTLRDFTHVAAQPWEDAITTPTGVRFTEAMDDDFNTRVALAALYDLVREINSVPVKIKLSAEPLVATLKALAQVLGLLNADPDIFLQSGAQHLDASLIEQLITERQNARLDKNYARCDAIRDELLAMSVILEDSKHGTSWRMKTDA